NTSDVNGDGQADLMLADLYTNDERGAAFLFYGPITGDLTPASAAETWTGKTWLGGFGEGFEVVGDVDGDGTDDFAIGAPQYWDMSDNEALYIGSGAEPGSSASDMMA